MDTLRLLRNEHALIHRELISVEEAAKALLNSEQSDRQKLTESLLEDCKTALLEIFRNFKKEEEALFPLLEERLDDGQELVHVMRSEHGEIIGTTISLLVEIVKPLGQSAKGLDDGLVKMIQNLRSLLSDHISAEDKVLFWLADLHLSISDRRSMCSAVAEVSRVT